MAVTLQSETRKQLLEAFTGAGDEFISGQKISELLGCSRTAVWKHIEDLRNEGYELEAVRRKGYRITKKPNKISSNEIQLGLQTKVMGRNVHFHEKVTSTQRVAHTLAHEGVKEGTIVLAEEQTEGRGRLNRSWFSPEGTGIWMSLIVRPNIPPQQAPQLTLLTAVAVAQGIEELTHLPPKIKWPNDILVNGKKVVGVLTELQAEPECIHSVIIGVGINVNQQTSDFPEGIDKTATSLAIETGNKLNRAELIQHILLKFEKLYFEYLKHGFLFVKLLWESYAVSIGKNIVVTTLNETKKGEALGITDEGVLMMKDEMDNIHYIHSADISIM
ncbi:biotin--[acetyl-CoA-carboxylase] ligase [Bacillus sp. SCS-151]|uniref:biotin--[acetyl-CoA-carboxylase] ligase n=1 Tax=Nanhaiella sioensis TaxID=3115293 RepID=UPI00397B17DE